MGKVPAAKSLIVAFLLAFLITTHPGGAQLADTDSPLIESAPAYTSSDVDAALKEVLPVVEEVTDRKLKRVPPIRLAGREEYAAVATRGRRQQDRVTSNQPKRAVTKPRSDRYVDYAFGAYESRNRTIYLLPGNFKPRLDRAGVPSVYHKAILKMVVAHELTHALQHQEVWSVNSRTRAGRPQRRISPDVVRALTEGHATFVMDQVAERLGFPEAIPEFHKTISAGLIPYIDPSNQDSNEDYREKLRSYYLDGERFIEWHHKRGGAERVWWILRNPPADWSVIENPETYRLGSSSGISRS